MKAAIIRKYERLNVLDEEVEKPSIQDNQVMMDLTETITGCLGQSGRSSATFVCQEDVIK